MIVENFGTFVKFFLEAGKDINAINQTGDTFFQSIKGHRQGEAYVAILEKVGAK